MAVTIKEIAAKAEVSYQAVSAVLNGNLSKASAQKRERIFSIARELGYCPNAAARALASGKTKLIGFITQDIRFPFHADLSYQLHQEAEKRGYRILMMESNWDDRRTLDCFHSMLTYQVDGILMIGMPSAQAENDLIRREKLPVVLVDDPNPDFCSIRFNHLPGMRQAFELLLSRGVRGIGFAHDPVNRQKVGAYLECCREMGIMPCEYHYKYPTVGGDRQVVECGRRIAADASRPEGLIVAADYEAALIMATLEEDGIRTPRDISIISMDDTFICNMVRPRLTAIRLDRAGMAKSALDTMERLIGSPDLPAEHYSCDSLLVERESVKK